jgi:hypothetical protein
MDHFLYIIIPTEANFVKVGRWSGEVVKLKQRYTTYYGFFEMIVFQCYNSIVLEYEVLREMKLFCFKGELFHKECVDMFMKIMNRKMGKEVFIQNKILNLEFLREKMDLEKKIDINKKLIKKEKEFKYNRQLKRVEKDNLKRKIKNQDIVHDLVKNIVHGIVENVVGKNSPFFCFLQEHSRFKQGNIVFIEDIIQKFQVYVDNYRIRCLDNFTFGQVNKEYIIETRKVCKHCKKVSHKDCCEKYKHIDRSKRKIVLNIELF